MPILGFINRFDSIVGTSNIEHMSFHLETRISGDVKNDFVSGIDCVVAQNKIKEVLAEMEGKYLDDIVGRATLENIALYVLFKLRKSIGCSSIRLSEGARYVELSKTDLPQDYSLKLLFKIGASKLVKKLYQEAYIIFSNILQSNPKLAEAYNCRGRCLKFMNRTDLALEDFSLAIEIKPNFGEAYRNRGNAKYCLGRGSDMLADYDKAVELMPDSALAINNRGFALQKLGDYKRALADHMRAIAIDPLYSEAFLDLAEALQFIGETKLAEAHRAKGKELIAKENPFDAEWRKIVYPK